VHTETLGAESNRSPARLWRGQRSPLGRTPPGCSRICIKEEEKNTQCLPTGKGVVGSAASGGAGDLLLFEELVRIQGLLEEALHRRRLHPQGGG
jgi:hypothetical protein